MIWPYLCAALAGSLAAVLAIASPARALTIEEALAEAARSSPYVRAARHAARANHEDVSFALSGWLPTVQVTANATVTRIGNTIQGTPFEQRIGSDGSDRETLELVYTHNLYRGGRDEAELRRARASVRQGHAALELTEQDVLLRAATAYLDVLRAEQTVELREASLVSLDARVRETTAQFRVGDRTQADVSQAEAEREVAAAEVTSAEANLEVQRALFQALVGLPAIGLEPAGEPAGLPETLDAALDAARSQRPAVRAALHAEHAATHSVRVAKGDLGPRVDLRATVSRRMGHGMPGFLHSTDQSGGIQLTVPLYQPGTSRLRQARYVLAQRRQQRAIARREAAQQAAAAWRNLNAARQRRAALVTAVAAANVALAGIRREAAIGERTTREVLDAERRLVQYRVEELVAERDAVVEAYTLLETTGLLTAHALGIQGLPDLEREARTTYWNFRPTIMLFD